MNFRTHDLQTIRSTTVDGMLRMRSGFVGRFSGYRLSAGAQR